MVSSPSRPKTAGRMCVLRKNCARAGKRSTTPAHLRTGRSASAWLGAFSNSAPRHRHVDAGPHLVCRDPDIAVHAETLQLHRAGLFRPLDHDATVECRPRCNLPFRFAGPILRRHATPARIPSRSTLPLAPHAAASMLAVRTISNLGAHTAPLVSAPPTVFHHHRWIST